MTIFPQTIRGKLGSAFGVVAVAAIVGGVVGQSSYDVIGQKLATITEVIRQAIVDAEATGRGCSVHFRTRQSGSSFVLGS